MTSSKAVVFQCVCLLSIIVLTGCASGKLTFDNTGAAGDRAIYNVAAIEVVNDVGDKCPPDVPENLQGAAIRQMKAKYPGAFEEVRPAAKGEEGELLVEVHITKYKKGSRFARAMLIGLGSSKISTDVKMVDAHTKEVLNSGELDLVWAIGGALGASKGIEDLVNSAGEKIADAIIEWK